MKMKIDPVKLEQCGKNLHDYLMINAAEKPDKVYLYTDDDAVTFRGALLAADRIAARLADFGVRKGDVVALRTTKSPETAVLFSALAAIGAVGALTDPHLTVREYLASSGTNVVPSFYLTNESCSMDTNAREGWTVSDGRREIPVVFSYGEEGEAISPEDVRCDTNPDDPFFIIFTSGSGGAAKAVLLSHANVISSCVDSIPLFDITDRDRVIALLPLHHILGLGGVLDATFIGHDVYFAPDLMPDTIFSAFEKYGITHFNTVPSLITALVKSGRYRDYDISSLRFAIVGGAAFTKEEMMDLEEKLGFRILPGYGMTECYMGTSNSVYDSLDARVRGVGRVFPMTEIGIFGENGTPVSSGEQGEIYIRGMSRMLGYYGDPEATENAIDAEGWFHTGDLGCFDGDGVLHVSGRKKDIIIRNGNNLSPAAIERKLGKLACVESVSVFGLSDVKTGEAPYAVISPGKEYAEITEEEMLRAAGTELNKLELPLRILLVPDLPLTSTGKPDKQRMKGMMQRYIGRCPAAEAGC